MPEKLQGSVGPEQQFKNYLSEGKFMIQRCKSLDRFFFHPRVAFPGTGERDLEWVEASGIGTAAALSDEDLIFPQYREAGAFLWRGFSIQ